MREVVSDEYELVGDDLSSLLPPRSVLANIKPKGIGTSFVESFMSYLQRLASLHHLSLQNLMRFIITNQKNCFDLHNNIEENYITYPFFNGIGTNIKRWVDALEQLTGRNDLTKSTLLFIKPFVTTTQLMSNMRKWCPLCLQDGLDAGDAYGQLLWEIDIVNACPKHQVELVSKCVCENISSLAHINIKYLPWICKYCGRFLNKNNKESIRATEQDIAIANLVAELLVDPSIDTSISNGDVANFLQNAVQYCAEGNAASLARILGVRKNVLHYWLHRKTRPTFTNIVNIAQSCNCSISNVLLGESKSIQKLEVVQATIHTSSQKNRWKKLSNEYVRDQLTIQAAIDPPVSVTQAAAVIGVNVKYLREHFKENTTEMAKRWCDFRKFKRELRVEISKKVYRNYAEEIARSGRVPTKRQIYNKIAGTSVLNMMYKKDSDICNAICKEVKESYKL